MATVTIREHVVTDVDSFGIKTTKSLNQDMVFVNDKLAGYLSHVSKKFMPISGWNDANSPMVCEALQKLKKDDFGKITYIDAPPLQQEAEIGDDDE